MIRRLMLLGLLAGLFAAAGAAQEKKELEKKAEEKKAEEKKGEKKLEDKKKEEAKPKAEGKVSTVKVLVPGNADVELTFDGKVMKTTGEVREFKTPALEAGKIFKYKVEAKIVPNNYTVITRPREVDLEGGKDLTIDLRTEDAVQKDKIVVRWVPTPEDVVDEMAKIAKVTKDDIVYDLGCGDAVMLIRPIKNLGAKKGVGIEIDAKIVETAKKNVEKEGLKDKIEIRQGDILALTDKDIGDATVVLLYIGDDLGAKLEPVLKKALKPGARVVSHRFTLGGWKPDKTSTFTGKDGDEYTLHFWEVKK